MELTEDQEQSLAVRARSSNSKARDTQWKRRIEIESIESEARLGVEALSASPLWTAGVSLYWAEGAKTGRRLIMANADPSLLRLFMRWCRDFHDLHGFTGAIHLHDINDERAALRFWSQELQIPESEFTKSFIKQAGTGHRNNKLEHGIGRVAVRRSTDAWIRTMIWIGQLELHL